MSKKNKTVVDEATLESVVRVLFENMSATKGDLTDELIKKMLQDVEIGGALQKIEREVAGRILSVKTDNEELRAMIPEIEARFNNVKFNRLFRNMLEACYYGYAAFEKVYNKEDYSLARLIYIPHKYVKYTKEKKWYISANNKELKLDKETFLLAIHRYNVANKIGVSILESCKIAFTDKEMFQGYLRSISQRYGNVITLFKYNKGEKREDVKQKVDDLRKYQDKMILAIPSDFQGTLKDNMQFINLSDLKPEIYANLQDKERKKIIQNLLGGTLSIDDGNGVGSRALGTVHGDGLEAVIKERCEFICDCLQSLLYYDGLYHGYDSKQFYFSLESLEDENDVIQKEKEKENTRAIKIKNFTDVRALGYKISKSKLAEALGLEEEDLEEVEELSQPLEFESKKKEKLQALVENVSNTVDKRLKNNQEKENAFSKKMNIAMKQWLKNPLEEELDLDMEILEEDYIIMFLLGYLDSQEKALEFEEELDPFSLSFTKAIKSIIDRNPAMYDTIEKIEEEARNRMFWIKKSTELEATKKVLTSLQKNLEKGGTYHEWKKDIESIAEKAGLGEDGWYSELVYRNAMNNAYAAGRYQEQMDNIKQRPYFMYSAINDDRTSEICRSLDGKVYPADDAIWHVIYPPNHHNCRSQVIALNEKEVQGYGLEIEKPDKEIKKMAKNMKNFNTAPNPNRLKKLEENVKIKEKQVVKIKETIGKISGAVKNSGALNNKNDPYGEKRDAHAERYYRSVRNRKIKFYINAIAKNTKMNKKAVENIIQHVFFNEYLLNGKVKRFDPNYDMSESFRRLSTGVDIQPHDIILLKHERLEYFLMKRYGYDYETAHNITERKYNYNLATDMFLEQIK